MGTTTCLSEGSLKSLIDLQSRSCPEKLKATTRILSLVDLQWRSHLEKLKQTTHILCEELLPFLKNREVGHRSMDAVPSDDGSSSLVSGGKSTTRSELSYTGSGTPAHQDELQDVSIFRLETLAVCCVTFFGYLLIRE